MNEQRVIRIQWIVCIASVLLLAIKTIAWYITHSVAILTDALESIVNVLAGFIGLYSLYLAAKPRDKEHPYGHGKVQYISAGIEGTLITIAGLVIIYSGIQKLIYPTSIHLLTTGIWLIALGGVVNFLLGWWAKNTGIKTRSIAIKATGTHLLSDAYSTAALLIGLIVMHFTNWLWLDAAIALIFGIIIIVTGIKLIRSSIGGIMDEADTLLLQNVVATLNEKRAPNWIDFHNVRFIQYGRNLHLDAHLTIPWYYNIREAHEVVVAVNKVINNHFADRVEMFVHNDPCENFSCAICSVSNCNARQHLFKTTITWTTQNIFENEKHQLPNG